MLIRIEVPDELAAALRRTPQELEYDLRLRALAGLVERGLVSSGAAPCSPATTRSATSSASPTSPPKGNTSPDMPPLPPDTSRLRDSPPARRKGLPRYPLPVPRLARLAVDASRKVRAWGRRS